MGAFLGKLLFPADSERAASDALSLFTVFLHSFTSLSKSLPSPPQTLGSTAAAVGFERRSRSSLTADAFAIEEEVATTAAAVKALFPLDASGWFRCPADSAAVAVDVDLC